MIYTKNYGDINYIIDSYYEYSINQKQYGYEIKHNSSFKAFFDLGYGYQFYIISSNIYNFISITEKNNDIVICVGEKIITINWKNMFVHNFDKNITQEMFFQNSTIYDYNGISFNNIQMIKEIYDTYKLESRKTNPISFE